MTDLDRAIIDLERNWFRQAGAKDQAILDRTGLTATAYFRILNRLIDSREALEYDPVTVNRLRRLRDQRARIRRAS